MDSQSPTQTVETVVISGEGDFFSSGPIFQITNPKRNGVPTLAEAYVETREGSQHIVLKWRSNDLGEKGITDLGPCKHLPAGSAYAHRLVTSHICPLVKKLCLGFEDQTPFRDYQPRARGDEDFLYPKSPTNLGTNP
ncbi:MAG: hypothetical protein WC796_01415 [Candidatus Pacearchaeota archaeon]|jgi:hypothetical protein